MASTEHRTHADGDSPRRHGPWHIKERRRVYRNPFIDVWEDQVVRPDGEPDAYATVTMKNGVAVLPLDEQRVHLTVQFRYALGRESIEVPSGAQEAGEEPLAAAQRELREELGLLAGRWVELGAVDLDTSIVRCRIHLFAATGIREAEREPDPSETIRPLFMPLAEAKRMAMEGLITHAPTCVLLLKVPDDGDRKRR